MTDRLATIAEEASHCCWQSKAAIKNYRARSHNIVCGFYWLNGVCWGCYDNLCQLSRAVWSPAIFLLNPPVRKKTDVWIFIKPNWAFYLYATSTYWWWKVVILLFGPRVRVFKQGSFSRDTESISENRRSYWTIFGGNQFGPCVMLTLGPWLSEEAARNLHRICANTSEVMGFPPNLVYTKLGIIDGKLVEVLTLSCGPWLSLLKLLRQGKGQIKSRVSWKARHTSHTSSTTLLSCTCKGLSTANKVSAPTR